MDKKIIKSDHSEIEKYKFHQNKSPISMNNIDIDKLPFGKQDFEYIISYKYSAKIRSICIFRMEILEKVINIIKNKFNSEII